MTKSAVTDWSTTAASNTIIDGADEGENCSMAGVNNSIRGLAAAVKGALTPVAASTADAGATYAATLSPAPDALAIGEYHVSFAIANSGAAPTLDFNGFGTAKPMVGKDGVTALTAGQVLGAHILYYDGTSLRVMNPNTGTLPAKTTILTADSVRILDSAAGNAEKTETIANLFPQSLGASGYITLPGGLILQWGLSGTVAGSSTGTVAYALPFTTAVYSIQITSVRASSPGDSGGAFVQPATVTLSGFTIGSALGGNSAFYWMACGK